MLYNSSCVRLIAMARPCFDSFQSGSHFILLRRRCAVEPHPANEGTTATSSGRAPGPSQRACQSECQQIFSTYLISYLDEFRLLPQTPSNHFVAHPSGVLLNMLAKRLPAIAHVGLNVCIYISSCRLILFV